jgi:flagellar hook protein FlgE
MQTRAAIEYTGAPLDLSIDGDGFFVVRDSSRNVYTRAGNFFLDSNNNLVTAGGQQVLGWMSDVGAGNADAADLNAIAIDPQYYNVTINRNGEVIGINSNSGEKETIARIAIASFSNQNGLEKLGESLYGESQNSGAPVCNVPGKDGTPFLNPSSLEMSNVDLAKEFTDMIITQRGFQANSRVITTSDQLLEELVNLKR